MDCRETGFLIKAQLHSHSSQSHHFPDSYPTYSVLYPEPQNKIKYEPQFQTVNMLLIFISSVLLPEEEGCDDYKNE
jgi:hypothetical protein